jgi:hypothetical protein
MPVDNGFFWQIISEMNTHILTAQRPDDWA